jgi:hypothetical protein
MPTVRSPGQRIEPVELNESILDLLLSRDVASRRDVGLETVPAFVDGCDVLLQEERRAPFRPASYGRTERTAGLERGTHVLEALVLLIPGEPPWVTASQETLAVITRAHLHRPVDVVDHAFAAPDRDQVFRLIHAMQEEGQALFRAVVARFLATDEAEACQDHDQRGETKDRDHRLHARGSQKPRPVRREGGLRREVDGQACNHDEGKRQAGDAHPSRRAT